MTKNNLCEIGTKLTEELLKITKVNASYKKEIEREIHLNNCDNSNCQRLYELRTELGLNNQTLEQYSKDFSSEDDEN